MTDEPLTLREQVAAGLKRRLAVQGIDADDAVIAAAMEAGMQAFIDARQHDLILYLTSGQTLVMTNVIELNGTRFKDQEQIVYQRRPDEWTIVTDVDATVVRSQYIAAYRFGSHVPERAKEAMGLPGARPG